MDLNKTILDLCRAKAGFTAIGESIDKITDEIAAILEVLGEVRATLQPPAVPPVADRLPHVESPDEPPRGIKGKSTLATRVSRGEGIRAAESELKRVRKAIRAPLSPPEPTSPLEGSRAAIAKRMVHKIAS